MDHAVPADHREKIKENKIRDKYLDLARELKKTMEHESKSDNNCNWCTWNDHQRLGKRAGGVGNRRTSGDNPNYNIVEVGPYTENSPGD